MNTIDEAIKAIARGDMVIVVDDDDRENEGDLVMAASLATTENMAFMIRHCCGIVCTPITAGTAKRLRLDPMVSANDAPLGTAFTVSVDYRHGLTTGISADERTATVRAIANRNVGTDDLVRPGHVFPLIAKDGGVLVRSGHTEAAVDLAGLAGQERAAVICELVNDDGTVKRLPELKEFAIEHNLVLVSIADLIEYRQRRERLVEAISTYETETSGGPARAIVYGTPFDAVQHMALVFGDIGDGDDVLARIHREQPMQDIFGRQARDFNDRILQRLGSEGRGVFILLRDQRAGLPSKQRNENEDDISNAAERRLAAWREVGIGAQILKDLDIRSIRLLATQERVYIGLSGFGIEITSTEILNS